MLTFTLLLAFLAGMLAPAPTAPAGNNALLNSEKLDWSTTRRLTWEDFKGTPDEGNPHHAVTAANLAVDAKCSDDKFTYDVKCVFLATESWSKNKVSEKLLQHEQLHFDLTEVHARLLRKKLQDMGSSCANVRTSMNTVVGAAFKAWKAEQDLFDKTSRHGLDAEEHEIWTADIAQRLQELEAYQ